MKKPVAAALVLILGLLGTSSQTSADIVNGGFEMPQDPGSPNPFPGWSTYYNNSGFASMASVGPGSPASEGSVCANLFVDAHADSFAGGGGGISHAEADLSQTFSATAGQSVSFDYYVPTFASGGSGSGMGGVSLQVSLSGGAYSESFGQSSNSSAYATYTFSAFTSDGTYTIDFHATADAMAPPSIPGDPNPPPPGSWNSTVSANIDNVRLSPVPEPCTLVLLGIAALGLLGYARRRRGRCIA